MNLSGSVIAVMREWYGIGAFHIDAPRLPGRGYLGGALRGCLRGQGVRQS